MKAISVLKTGPYLNHRYLCNNSCWACSDRLLFSCFNFFKTHYALPQLNSVELLRSSSTGENRVDPKELPRLDYRKKKTYLKFRTSCGVSKWRVSIIQQASSPAQGTCPHTKQMPSYLCPKYLTEPDSKSHWQNPRKPPS